MRKDIEELSLILTILWCRMEQTITIPELGISARAEAYDDHRLNFPLGEITNQLATSSVNVHTDHSVALGGK